MRRAVSLVFLSLLIGGCKPLEPDGGVSSTSGQSSTRAGKEAKETPVTSLSGKIVRVKPNLQFVVIDFFLSSVPPLELRMAVYRDGQKVGEVKITGPSENKYIAADLVRGDAQVGDEVRPE